MIPEEEELIESEGSGEEGTEEPEISVDEPDAGICEEQDICFEEDLSDEDDEISYVEAAETAEVSSSSSGWEKINGKCIISITRE